MTPSRRKIVAGNWKMNGNAASNHTLIAGLISGIGETTGVEIAVCVPSIYLFQVSELLRDVRIRVGAQNLSEYENGAYTGELSGEMLVESGSKCVLVGHSERRALNCESNAQVANKFKRALAAGIEPILCVGESLAERESGATEAVVGAQIDAVLELVGVSGLGRGIVAYEPVWAIGTGKTATPEQAQAVHAFIRSRVATRDAAVAAKLPILYGGSVKAGNAATLFACPDIDGGLVGGASLQAQEFVAICKAAC